MRFPLCLAAVVLAHVALVLGRTESKHHLHHKHHHQHHKHGRHHSARRSDVANTSDAAAVSSANTTKTKVVLAVPNATMPPKVAAVAANATTKKVSAIQMSGKMQAMEKELSAKEAAAKGIMIRGRLHVNGPLPAGFNQVFGQGVSKATNCEAGEVNILDEQYTDGSHTMVILDFEAPNDVVHKVEDQAADPYSKLANGILRPFLVAGASQGPGHLSMAQVSTGEGSDAEQGAEQGAEEQQGEAAAQEPCAPNIDIDTDMPYGELEPFGREDTAQELTEQSITESDEMVDQLERAEVAEEKRAVFRALTRLRGAAITSFDGIARSQTGNIDEYNKVHKWRMTHPLRHLADEESDISKWAFPDNADF